MILVCSFVVAHHEEYASDQAAAVSTQPDKSAITAEPDKYHAQENLNKSHWDAPRGRIFREAFRWPQGTGIWALILTLLAIAEQTEHTRKSAQAALLNAQAVINSERAWILVKNIVGPKDWWDPNDPAYTAGAVMQFAVCGNTPARINGASFEIKRVPTKSAYPLIPDLPEEPVYPPQSDSAEIPENGRILPPRDRFSVDLILNPPLLCEQEWNDIWDRKVCICAYGYVRYTDAFDRKHETRVCYVYEISPGIITAVDGSHLNPDRFKIGGPSAYNKAT